MGNPAPPHPELLWYARFKEQNTVRAERLVRVWRKEELGNLSTTFQSKSRVFWKKPTTFSSKLERGACHECRRSKAFSPMKDFFLQECENDTDRYLSRLLRSSMPCLYLTGKGREPLLMRRSLQSVLPLLSLGPCRIPNRTSCIKGHRLPQLQVTTGLCARQGKDPGTPALPEHHQSITSTIYCWQGWAAAWQQLQPSFSSERATNSCCAERRVVASLRSCCRSTAISTELCHWGVSLTAFEDLKNQQDLGAGSLFLTGKGPNQLLLPAPAEFGARLLPPLPKRQKQPFLRAAASAPRSCWAQQ